MSGAPRFRWQEHFVSYRAPPVLYIYCDTNASYASVHQHLEGGHGRPCVVANGDGAEAGVCLAVSYEAKALGVRRGGTVREARALVPGLVVYQCCLPLYEIYADLYDRALGWIVPRDLFRRGSCDEVLIAYEERRYPYRDFRTARRRTIAFVEDLLGARLDLPPEPDREALVAGLAAPAQAAFAIATLVRDVMWAVLGLPVSVGVAPSISLAKALVGLAKPAWRDGRRVYRTVHRAVAFPQGAEEANVFLRGLRLTDLCGAKETALRLAGHGFRTVADIQDGCSLESAVRLCGNTVQGKVIWFACHGRDDALPGYLSALRGRWCGT